jgi:tripartite ATP-independent transporter DctP family solute receptor
MASPRVLALLFVLTAACSASARDLRVSDTFPIDHPTVRAVEFIGDALRERTRGRLVILRRAENDQDSDSFIVGQVRNGALDMARINLNALNVSVPGSVLPTLPFVFKSRDHMRRTLDGPVGEEILASLERQGLIGLCFYDGGTRSFYSRSRPIRSAADLKGLKVRVQRADSWAILLRALGAEPVTVPMTQVRAALQAGVVDATDGDWATYMAGEHHSVAPFYSLTEHSQPPSVLIFSQRTWRTLSAADQKLLREAARESVGYMRGLIDDYESGARKRAEAAGVRIEENVDRRSFIEAMVPLYSAVVEESNLRGTMTRIQAEQ